MSAVLYARNDRRDGALAPARAVPARSPRLRRDSRSGSYNFSVAARTRGIWRSRDRDFAGETLHGPAEESCRDPSALRRACSQRDINRYRAFPDLRLAGARHSVRSPSRPQQDTRDAKSAHSAGGERVEVSPGDRREARHPGCFEAGSGLARDFDYPSRLFTRSHAVEIDVSIDKARSPNTTSTCSRRARHPSTTSLRHLMRIGDATVSTSPCGAPNASASASRASRLAAACIHAPLGPTGLGEFFIPGVRAGERYKFEIRSSRTRAAPQDRPYGMRSSAARSAAIVHEADYAWDTRSG